MDFAVVEGVADNDGLIMKWIKYGNLGKGSYGHVYLAKLINSVYNDRVFAVKSCRYHDSDSLQMEKEIFKEFAGCDKIVKCYGDMVSIEQQEMVYNLFLEYAPGGSLCDLIMKYGGKIPENDVRCYAKMMLEGTYAIHARGYVHCDLKPANILVFPPDRCGSLSNLKIADFGLVRRPEELEVEACMLNFPGTAIYMPPESITTGRISPALDIWSIGCIVLEMITGKLPWEYKNLADLAMKIGSSRHSPKIPETLSSTGKDFLMKCFERDPTERWSADMLLSHPFLLPQCPSLPSPTEPRLSSLQ